MSSELEVERIRAYAARRGLSLVSTEFAIGPSDQLLPSADPGPIDLLFIDGGHAFPLPEIDWFYGALHLRSGGLVIVDDVQLPHVSDFLIAFLDKDPRWERLALTPKWAAFRKLGEFSVRENWTQQPFLGEPRSQTSYTQRTRSLLRRGFQLLVPAGTRRALRRVLRRL